MNAVPAHVPGRARRAASILLLGLTALSCGDRDVQRSSSTPAGVTEAELRRVAGMKIYFGHQSVGADILAGVEEIARSNPQAGLRVVEARDASAFDAPAFGHSLNGENERPDTKIDAFEKTLGDGLGGRVDVAFFKFCYVDIRSDSDVAALFERYKSRMASLRERFPTTTVVHVTSPLTTIQSGPKAWVKRLLGRPDGYARDNVQRARFNELLKQEYRGEPVFDLAEVESTWEDGRRGTFEQDGRTYGALIEAYSYDGKHLNERGRKWAATRLLSFLASAEPRGNAGT